MASLLDSGILIRLVHRADPQHATVDAAVAELNRRGEPLCCDMQNVAEFWDVSTRPMTARGGFGLTLAEAEQRLAIIERIADVLTEADASYAEWKRLVVRHGVSGVQVHDTRRVDLMAVNGVSHPLTLNPADFKRFPNIAAVMPAEVLSNARP